MEIASASWVAPANRIYIYTYIRIYKRRGPIGVCDMVSHLTLSATQRTAYMDRGYRGIYMPHLPGIYMPHPFGYI